MRESRSHVMSPPLHSQTRPFYLYTPPSPSSNSNSGSLPLSNFSKFPSTKSSSAGSPPLHFSSFPPPPPAPITSSPRKSQPDVNWFSLIPFNSPLLPSEQSFPPPPTASPRISSTSVSNSPPNRPSPSYLGSSSPAPTRTPVKQLASPWLPETPEPSLAISPPPKQIYPPILSQFVPSIRPPNLVSQPTPPPPTHSSQTRFHVPPSRFDSNHSEIGKFTPLKDGIGSVLISIYALVGLIIILVITLALTLSKKNKKRQIMNSAESYRHDRSNSSPIKSGYIYNQASETNPSGDSNYRSIPGPEHLAVRNSSSSYTTHGFELGYVDPETGNSVTRFTFEELVFITNGFSSHNLLGEGGFGYVYKGRLPNGREVTVKQLKFGNWQSELEFKAEVEIISHIHYNHLVSLVGYCIMEQHRFLVHEFVPNGTLEYHLHEVREPVLDWPKRIKIAIGAAKGLAYLHEDCHPWIIHQDIKSANILLDDSFEAKIADFGLTNFLNVRTRVSVHDMGTLGYMAPEYTSAGKLTDRSDVFSFGVVLLELITGCKPIDPSQSLGGKSLVERARPLLIHAIDTGAFEGLVDPRLENNYAKNEMVRMMETAAACVRHSALKRPRMVQVAQELESLLDREEDLPDASNGVNIFQSHNYNPGIQINHHMPYSNSGDSVSYASNQNLANNSELNPMTHHGLPTSCTSGDSQKSSSSEWITLDCHERMNQA